MAVNLTQSNLDTLAINIKTTLFKVSYAYVIKENNGIQSPKIKRDVIRLNSFLKAIENYDITQDYYNELFITTIEREYLNFCGYKDSYDSSSSAPNILTNSIGINPIDIYRFNTNITITANKIFTGFVIPKTVILFVEVILSGYTLDIGNGNLTREAYFSSDGGVTAKEIKNIIAGDKLFINALNIKASITPSDLFLIKVL